MLLVRLANVFAALLLASATATAQGVKLTDPQIAHIAYTADQIDIEAAHVLFFPRNRAGDGTG